MRNSEPDSKHFVESLDFLSIPCQNPQKPPQNCTIDLLCGFLRNWWVMISLLDSHLGDDSRKSTSCKKFWELRLHIHVAGGPRPPPRAV